LETSPILTIESPPIRKKLSSIPTLLTLNTSLTINGKLDRHALPTPEFVSTDKYVAPRNELEEQLCNIWQEVLSVKRVGIDDNFFRIGGDSIVSIGLVSKMRREGFSLQVKDIFDAPTVAQLSLSPGILIIKD
jgi:aryl carrier-like protein